MKDGLKKAKQENPLGISQNNRVVIMVLFDKFLDYFCSHAAVVNEDKYALEKEVEIVKKKYGLWFRVRGFTEYKQLFYALHIAKAKRNPYSVAFLRENESVCERIIQKSDPEVKTYKYSDTQNLLKMLPSLR